MNDRAVALVARLALALFVLAAALSSTAPGPVVVTVTALTLATITVLPRSGPLVLIAALAVGAGVTVLCHGDEDSLGWFTLCLLAGYCALRGGRATVLTSSVAAIGVLVGQTLTTDGGWVPWFAGTAFSVVVCLMARRQQQLIAELRQAQAGLTERVRAEERNRVARELHDVIAHSLTVSLLHVSGARLAVEEDPAQALDALTRAEQLGRQSLTEVRQAVGVLRQGSEPSAPLPGVDQLVSLIEGFRRAGAPVAYQVIGDPQVLPATTGLTLYRVLQESLTNACRHAPGTPTAVRLEVVGQSARLTVDSAGAPVPATGAGLGLLSMTERAAALGGQCSAGPAGTGWRVHAVLPGNAPS